MDYYLAFKTNDNILKGLNDSYDYYVISLANYQAFYQNQDFKEYDKFFKKNYAKADAK